MPVHDAHDSRLCWARTNAQAHERMFFFSVCVTAIEMSCFRLPRKRETTKSKCVWMWIWMICERNRPLMMRDSAGTPGRKGNLISDSLMCCRRETKNHFFRCGNWMLFMWCGLNECNRIRVDLILSLLSRSATEISSIRSASANDLCGRGFVQFNECERMSVCIKNCHRNRYNYMLMMMLMTIIINLRVACVVVVVVDNVCSRCSRSVIKWEKKKKICIHLPSTQSVTH